MFRTCGIGFARMQKLDKFKLRAVRFKGETEYRALEFVTDGYEAFHMKPVFKTSLNNASLLPPCPDMVINNCCNT